jgi:hypothetical protein
VFGFCVWVLDRIGFRVEGARISMLRNPMAMQCHNIYIYIGPFQQDYYAGGVVKVKKVKVSATGKGKHTVFADE